MKKLALSILCVGLLLAQEEAVQQNSTEQKAVQVQESEKKESQDENALFGSKAKEKSGFVIGIFGGASFSESDTEYYTLITDFEGSDRSVFGVAPNYGIKLGYDLYFTPSHAMRMYVDYMGSSFISDNDIVGKYTIHTLALNVEYKYDITEKFGVFAGVNLNYSLYDTQRAGSSGAVGFGVNAGFTYSIFSWMELELGFRYLGDSFKEVNVTPDALAPSLPTLGQTYQRVEIGDLFAGRLGLNFKF